MRRACAEKLGIDGDRLRVQTAADSGDTSPVHQCNNINMKTRHGFYTLAALAVAVVTAISAPSAQAQSLVTYTQGDLLLGFHKNGVSNDVVVNIGQASL